MGGLGAQDVLHDASLLDGQFLKAVFVLLSFRQNTQDFIQKSPGEKSTCKKHCSSSLTALWLPMVNIKQLLWISDALCFIPDFKADTTLNDSNLHNDTRTQGTDTPYSPDSRNLCSLLNQVRPTLCTPASWVQWYLCWQRGSAWNNNKWNSYIIPSVITTNSKTCVQMYDRGGI